MRKGTFELISESYSEGGKNLFHYSNNCPLLFRPILLLYAVFVSLMLYMGSLMFYLLRIFDLLGNMVDSIRKAIFRKIEDLAYSIDQSVINFIVHPWIIAILCPLFLISTLIPKLSSQMNIGPFGQDVVNGLKLNGRGTFKKIINLCLRAIKKLYKYISFQHILIRPLLIIPCLCNSIVLMLLIILSTPLLIFDIISHILDAIKMFCIKITKSLSISIKTSFTSFLFNPILLLFLLPMILIVLIVPKFSSTLDLGI